MSNIILFLLSIALLPSIFNCTRFHSIYVGVISERENEDIARQNNQKFWTFNQSSNVILQPLVERVLWWDSLQVTRAVCRLLKVGVHALVSNSEARFQNIVKAYSSKFHIPLVSASSIHKLETGVYIMPEVTQLVGELLKDCYGWSSFIYFYDSDDGIAKLEKLLDASDHKISVEAVWRVVNGDQAYRFLASVRNKEKIQVLLATKHDTAKRIINFMAEMRQKWTVHFIFLDPVVKLDINLNTNGLENVLVTVLSLPENPKSSARRDLENRWHALTTFKAPTITEIPNSALVTKDIADVIEQGFVRLLQDSPSFDISIAGIDCFENTPANTQHYVSTITHHLKQVVLENGLTGNIRFSANGERVGFFVDIDEMNMKGYKKVGSWSAKSGLIMLNDCRDKTKLENIAKEKRQMQKITITTVVDGVLLTTKNGNRSRSVENVEGFLKDVLDVIAKSLKWNYTLRFISLASARKESAEKIIDNALKKEEDLLIAPFLSTKDLAKADVSKPILNFGMTILAKKPDEGRFGFSPFGIVQVWSYKVWLILILIYVVISGANFAVAYFTETPDRIRSLDTKQSDRLSICSSFWFTVGSLTFRDTGIYPRSSSHRILSIFWWIFTLVTLMLYISSLSSLMIRNRIPADVTVHPPSAEAFLRNFLEKGHPRIGAPYEDHYFSTFSFAESGLLGEYQAKLDNDFSLILDSYQEGLRKLRDSDGDFAFVVNSFLGHRLSGSEACDTTVLPGFLIHKPLVIAFKKGSSLKYPIDDVILDLDREGEFRRLYEKWWFGNRTCEDPNLNILPRLYSNSLSLTEASGVFIFFICGVIVTCACAAAEYFLRWKKMPVRN